MWTLREIIKQCRDEELDYKLQICIQSTSNTLFQDIKAVDLDVKNKTITFAGKLL